MTETRQQWFDEYISGTMPDRGWWDGPTYIRQWDIVLLPGMPAPTRGDCFDSRHGDNVVTLSPWESGSESGVTVEGRYYD